MLNNGSFGPILQEWIFPLDTDKIYVEQEFDGKCYCYFVQGYRYVDYPGLEDRWFAPDDDGDYVFDQDLCLMDPWKENLRYIYARGKYMFMAEVAHPIEWKYRSVRLYITIV